MEIMKVILLKVVRVTLMKQVKWQTTCHVEKYDRRYEKEIGDASIIWGMQGRNICMLLSWPLP